MSIPDLRSVVGWLVFVLKYLYWHLVFVLSMVCLIEIGIFICIVICISVYHIYDLLKGDSKCKNQWLGFIHDWPENSVISLCFVQLSFLSWFVTWLSLFFFTVQTYFVAHSHRAGVSEASSRKDHSRYLNTASLSLANVQWIVCIQLYLFDKNWGTWTFKEEIKQA